MKFQMVQFDCPEGKAASAALIFSMGACTADFAVNRFEEGMIWSTRFHKSMEAVIDVVGSHVFVKRIKVCDNCLTVLTREAS